MLNKEIPFLRIGLPLCAGIVAGLCFNPGDHFFILAGIAVSLCFGASLAYNKYLTNLVYGLSLTLALFFCGLFLYTKEKNRISCLEPEETIFTACLSDFPEEKENSIKMVLKLDRRITANSQVKVSGSILLYNKKGTATASFLPGDLLVIRCTPVEITSRGNPFEFDYRFYMKNQGIRYYAFTDSSDIFKYSVTTRRKLIHKALIIREKIIDMFRERGIEGDRLALVAAITLGQKNMLDPEQKQHFIKAGVMHIMAVSGLHALILSLFVFKMLFFLKGRYKILRVLITILILWLFAFVTGLHPSVLRATLMFSFLQAGNMLKRPVNGINSVLASAFVLIMIRPSVIFDTGFLLSYSAVIYIICFYRAFYLKIPFKHRLPDLIWQSAAVTIIAQAGTLPLTVMLFNRFPTWFILSNIVIVPLASLVIIVGCLVPLTYPLHFLSQFLAGILNHLTGLTELLTEKASSLPLSTIENIGLTPIECILLMVTIFLFIQFLIKRKSISVLLPVTSLLLLVLAGTIRDISTRSTKELIVYNTIGNTTLAIRTGRILNLYTDTCMTGQEVNRHSSALNLKIRRNIIDENTCQIRTGNKNILITSYLNSSIVRLTLPDIVILRGRTFIEKNIQSEGKPAVIIISPNALQGNKFTMMVRSWDADTVHFVKKEGAFYMKL